MDVGSESMTGWDAPADELHEAVACGISSAKDVKVHLLSGEELIVPAELCSNADSISAFVAGKCNVYVPQVQLTVDGAHLNDELIVFDGVDLQGIILPADFAVLVFKTFNAFGLKEQLLQNVHARFQIPYPAQQRGLMPILLGKHVCVQAGCRAGKTTTLAMSAIQRVDPTQKACQILIITADRETAMQIQDLINNLSVQLDVSCCMIVGGIEQRPAITAAREGTQIFIGTPGRINGLISRRLLSLENLVSFAIDDVDKLVDIGFKDQVLDIFAAMGPEVPQVVMTSSTDADAESIALLETVTQPLNMLSIKC